MESKFLTDPGDIAASHEVMVQLRPHLSVDQYTEAVLQQLQSGYQLLAAIDKGLVLGLVGFWIGHKLAWGRHIYIDDLVTDDRHRSRGVGKFLLDNVMDYGQQQGCKEVHLDSGVQRFEAHQFYLREKFIISSHHFVKQV